MIRNARMAAALCAMLLAFAWLNFAQTSQPSQTAQPSQPDQPPVLVRTNSPSQSGAASSQAKPAENGQAAGLNKAAASGPAPIPAGTTLRVQLDTTLTDKTNKTGDPFTGEIIDPVMANGKDLLPKYSTVNGHIAFLKPSGRVEGKAQMRLVIDNITTPDGVVYPLSGTLEQAQGGVCAHASNIGKTKADEEGTITGCGKSKKSAAKAAAIVGGMGAGVGASIGMGKVLECEYYGYCPPGGSGMGTDIMYGAGIGATTALIYTIFKHERHIVLVQGSDLTFVVNRTTMASKAPSDSTTASDDPQ
ncbi:MAG: hypothetical protein KGM47_00980 [Acidobacteriota bacterium]|nr:hypothetical protein [Acidobacteriota bacterium]